MTPEKEEVLREKLVELKETPGKNGEVAEKRGEPRKVPSLSGGAGRETGIEVETPVEKMEEPEFVGID